MPWVFDDNRPIYTQLLEKIRFDIIAGIYKPGDRLPSVRELAAEAAVNPNTMQKALSDLERTGLIFSKRTNGRFITEDIAMIQSLKTQLAEEKVSEFMEQMKQLGFTLEETIQIIQSMIREEK